LVPLFVKQKIDCIRILEIKYIYDKLTQKTYKSVKTLLIRKL